MPSEIVSPTALLHGDLTPRNILDGGDRRGLVAIDPAPCLGADLAFDAIDLLLWRADDVDMIAARAEQLAPAIDVDASRLLDWCTDRHAPQPEGGLGRIGVVRLMRSVEGEQWWEDDDDRGGPQGKDGKIGGLPALEPVEPAASCEESGGEPGGARQVHE